MDTSESPLHKLQYIQNPSTVDTQWRMQDFLKGGSVVLMQVKFLEATPTFD